MTDRFKDSEMEIVGRDAQHSQDESEVATHRVSPKPEPEVVSDAEQSETNESDVKSERAGDRNAGKSRSILKIFLGNYIAGEQTKNMLPYMIFVTILAIIYIFNGFAMNAQHRKRSILIEQVKELRSKSMAFNAQKMQELRRSSILKRCQEQGLELEESVVPPKIVEK